MKNITRLKHPEYEKKAFDYLIERYKADPEWFERNLPDITGMVREASLPPSPPRPSFNLPDDQRQRHAKALNDILNVPELSPQDALDGLEHCAILLHDSFTALHGIRDKKVIPLFKAAFGKSPESFAEDTTIPIEGHGTGKPFYHSSLLRGVMIALDNDRRLVSVTITPNKIREGKRMMRLVGIAHDSRDDISINHDDYLAELYYEQLHGSDWLTRH